MITKEIVKRAKAMRNVGDLTPLINNIKNARVVMLGEASHGTHEFYEWRAKISKELIEKHGFNFIAVEGDWPACQALNKYTKTRSDEMPQSVLKDNFKRWPTWMWANQEIADLADWMKKYNLNQSDPKSKIGFHGLDVYSLFESIEEVLKLLQQIAPDQVEEVRKKYACFDRCCKDEKQYIRGILKYSHSCEKSCIQALQKLLETRMRAIDTNDEKLFDAIQNARIVKNAEYYYRAMLYADDITWNIRDQHMMDTLDMLLNHYGPNSKAIVWEHNTHIGDYRATDMVKEGQVNIGGLAREKYGEDQIALVGFGTYEGSVIASRCWDGPIEKKAVPTGKPGSYEDHFHNAIQDVGCDNFFIIMEKEARRTALAQTCGHRAIGVVYEPSRERYGNYVPTSLANRYDAFVFLNQTQALHPLHVHPDFHEIPETFPSGV